MPELPPLKTKVSADTGDFVSGISRASSSVGQLTGAVKLGAAALAAYAGTRGLQAAVQESMKLEEQTAELAKLVGERLADPLADSIVDMSNEMPIARDRLFEVAETATRLGVRGEKNIRAFTETAAQIGVATDSSAQEAANAFARIGAMTDTGVEDMDRLASSANALSNTMATSFSEIQDATLRSSAELTNFGLRSTDIFAVNAAMNEVSESAQRAGTRLRRLAQELQDPRKVEVFADVLGITVDEFQRLREEDPAQIILGLARVMREGGDAADELRRQTTTVTQTALAGLGNNIDGLVEALGRARTAFDENTSLQEEYARFADTAAARTKVLRNRMNNLQASIGNRLLPTFVDLLEKANFLAGALFDVSDAAESLENADAVMGLEALDKAFRQLVTRSDLTTDNITQVRENIEEAAGRFDDAGNRATFLSEAVDAVRNSTAQTPEDVQQLSVWLATLYQSLKRVEDQAGGTGRELGEGSDFTSGAREAEEATQELLERIREQRDELKFTTQEIVRQSQAYQQAPPAIQAKIDALLEEIAALEAKEEAEERAQEAAEERLEALDRQQQRVRENRRRRRQQIREQQRQFLADLQLEEVRSEIRRTEQAADRMASTVVSTFADMASGSQGPIQAIIGLIQDLIQQLAQLAAQELFLSLFQDVFSGLIGGGIPDAPAAIPEPAAPDLSFTDSLPGFQEGGSFRVGGAGGPDSQSVAFRASPGELVSVLTKEQQARARSGEGGATEIHLNQTINIPSLDQQSVSRFVSQNRALFAKPALEALRRSRGLKREVFG